LCSLRIFLTLSRTDNSLGVVVFELRLNEQLDGELDSKLDE
jgi:hypothetical protein